MSYQDFLAALRRKATEIRIDTLEAIANAKSGHTGSALSVVDILVALYYGETSAGPILNIDPARPGWEGQDYVILSKANAAPAWYAILADLGYFSRDELRFLKQSGGMLTAVPRSKIPGVAVSSGFSGQGLAGAIGLAMDLKSERHRNKVFAIIGDAELASGDAMAALLQAGHHKLGNLLVIVDRNGVQMEGVVRNANIAEPMSDKFDAMGFRSINVFAGHDYDQLLGAYEKALQETRLPVAIICKTVKGKGVDFAENKSFYHDSALSREELTEALSSLRKRVDSFENTGIIND